MAREGLRYELSIAFREALRLKKPVMLKNIVVGTNGGTQTIDVTIQTICAHNALKGMVLIVFADVVAPHITKASGKLTRRTVSKHI